MSVIGCDIKLELPVYGRELRRHCKHFAETGIFPEQFTCVWRDDRLVAPELFFKGGRTIKLVPLDEENTDNDQFNRSDIYLGLHLVWERPQQAECSQEEKIWLDEFTEALRDYLEGWLAD